MENKRKAEESALVPVPKKQKNEVATKSKNTQALQAVRTCILLKFFRFNIYRLLDLGTGENFKFVCPHYVTRRPRRGNLHGRFSSRRTIFSIFRV